MLIKFISLAVTLLGLSEVENVIYDKFNSTEKVVILCPNGQITIERKLEPVAVVTNVYPGSDIYYHSNGFWTPALRGSALTVPGLQYQPTPNTTTNVILP